MKERLGTLATFAGYLGAALFIVAIAGRFYGEKPFLGFKAMNLFFVGMGVIMWGVWARLESK